MVARGREGYRFEVVFGFLGCGIPAVLISSPLGCLFLTIEQTNFLRTGRFQGKTKTKGKKQRLKKGRKDLPHLDPPFPIDASRHERKRVTGKSPQMFPF